MYIKCVCFRSYGKLEHGEDLLTPHRKSIQPSCCEAIANDVTVLHSVHCFKSECYDLIDFRPERYVRYWY